MFIPDIYLCVQEEPVESVVKQVKQEQESAAIPSTDAVSAPVASPPIKDELSSIMEECKRLTSDNSRLKQLYDEAKVTYCYITEITGLAL